MKLVAKYNVYKAISTLLTGGVPIITLICCGDFFVHRSDTAISAAGVFALLIFAVIMKDKLASMLKTPPMVVVCIAVWLILELITAILEPIKLVCKITIITSGIDWLTFDRFCKGIEIELPEKAVKYKHAGFLITTSKKLLGDSNG